MWISRHHRNVIIVKIKKVEFFPHQDPKERKISVSEHEIRATNHLTLMSSSWAAVPAFSLPLPRLHAK